MNSHESYRRGMAAYNAGAYDEAIQRLGPLVGTSGTTGLLSRFYLGQAHHQIALDHFVHRRFKEAAGQFERAAELNPFGGGVERFLAACYVKTGRLDRAVERLKSLLARDPDDIDTRVRLALSLWKTARASTAMQTLTEGIVRRPDNAELHYQLGVMYAAREAYAQAEACFRRAASFDGRHVGALERLAQCCSVRGDHAGALESLQLAHALDPEDPRIGFQLSMLAQGVPGTAPVVEGKDDLGDGQASPAFHRPTRLPDQAAIERLGGIIVNEPDFVSAFLDLPASDVDQEVFSILAATLERALAEHPEYADLHYHCGAVYRRLGREAAAIEHAERAVRINPRFINALILLAELYAQTDRWLDGVGRLEEAIRQGADYPDVHYMVGQLHHRAGQVGPARDAFKRALMLKSDFQPARDALNVLPGSHS